MSEKIDKQRLSVALGSLRLTLWLIVLLLLSITAIYLLPLLNSSWLALPFVLLAINLIAAMSSNKKFRRQLPLVVFHLALLALIILIAAGRLSYLKGWVEVTVGEPFSGKLTSYTAGPLHYWRLDDFSFVLEKFSIDYDPGLQRGATRAHMQWQDKDSEMKRGIVGDHRPLILSGYRFYTSHNKGFAPIFSWQPTGGEAITGSIHLPAYPANEYRQALEWSPPGSKIIIWTQLQFDELILDPEKSSQFRPPQEHLLVMRIDDQRFELKPGESLELPEGRLIYKQLQTWMGFNVLSDWTMAWLLATGLFAVLALGWHYWRKYSIRPWLEGESLAENSL